MDDLLQNHLWAHSCAHGLEEVLAVKSEVVVGKGEGMGDDKVDDLYNILWL